MTRSQAIRIAALWLLIFAAGIATGRLSAPKPQVIVLGPSGTVRMVETVLARLDRQIGLSEEEETKVRALLEEIEQKIVHYPLYSEERMEVFRSYVPKMREILPTEKHRALDRYVRDAERRQQMLRRRRGNEQPTQ